MHAADAHWPSRALEEGVARRVQSATRREVRLRLLVYGLAWALLSAVWLAQEVPDRATFMDSRVEAISSSIRVLDEGGPPLLGSVTSYRGPDVDPRRDFAAVGDLPSPGLYLYFPLLAQLTGVDDPRLILKWFFIALTAILLAVYPLVFFQLLGSVPAALVAPLLVAVQFRFAIDTDVYWLSAWTILLGVPLLAYRASVPAPLSYAFLVSLAAFAGFATSVRVGSGLPVLLGLLAVAIWRCRGRRLLSVLLVLLVYMVTSSWMFRAVEAYRDEVVGFPVPRHQPSLWHSVYLGFGYGDNPYGIFYDDGVTVAHARRVDPNVAYFERNYGSVVRSMVVDVTRENPRFVITTTLAKLKAVVAEAVSRFWTLLLLLPFALARARRSVRLAVLLSVPALVVGVVPPVVVMPYTEYAMTWLAAWGFVWVLVAAWAVGAVVRAAREPALVADRVGSWPPLLARARSSRGALAALAVVAFAFASGARFVADGIGAVTESASTETFYRIRQAALLYSLPPAAEPIIRWDARDGLPSSWLVLGGDVTPLPAGGVAVTTTSSRFDYQLQGPVQELGPGEYLLVVDGRPVSGGVELGVLDLSTYRWIETSHFWDAQGSFDTTLMSARFRLDKFTSVQPVLSNWRPEFGRSAWVLRSLTLYRVQPPRVR